MKPESLKNIKAELLNIPAKEVLEICLRLAKFKQENKELLTYLLFQQYDKHLFISNVKEHMKSEFKFMNDSSFYLAKKPCVNFCAPPTNTSSLLPTSRLK